VCLSRDAPWLTTRRDARSTALDGITNDNRFRRCIDLSTEDIFDVKNLYDRAVLDKVHERIARLRPDSDRLWGRMDAAQALAHCALAMENALGDTVLPRHPLGRLIGGRVKRSMIVKGKPMGRNARTHPSVLVQDVRDFDVERQRLRRAVDRFASGPAACTPHPHFFFGPMTPLEWATFMYIHLDHHLRQFQV
jgi:hypothetical protein